MKYVDIHSHILPGMDDGSKDMDMTRDMLRMYSEEGVGHIVATPHYRVGYMDYDMNRYNKKLEQVRQLIKEEGMDITLHQGQELYFDYANLKDIEEGHACTIAGSRYVLFELANYVNKESLYEYLYNFELKNYRMILAHVERYELFREKPELLMELYHKGVLFQVNSRSVSSRDRRMSKWVDRLLKKGYVHFISTDAHSLGQRKPAMKDKYRYIENLLGRRADDIYCNNGLKVIRNEEIYTEEPEDFRRQPFLFKRRT